MTDQVLVIGASIGGYEALASVLAPLPADFALPVLAVLHTGAYESSVAQLLASRLDLSVRYARDRDELLPGQVLLAPPDCHLLVRDDHVCLSHGPKENFSRPAVDPLFRSAAIALGPRVIGLVLTGNLDDGTVGLQAVHAYGGVTMVQDPATALAPSMPLSALHNAEVDYCLPLSDIAPMLVKLARQPAPRRQLVAHPEIETEMRYLDQNIKVDDMQAIGEPSSLTCPECGGALWKIRGPDPERYRCHVGHAYTAQSLKYAQGQRTDEAIWAAIRALHEKENLLRRFAQSASDPDRAHEHQAAAEQARQHSEELRRMVAQL